MGRRATIPHWTSSLANLSLYRRPTFVHVHVPELAYTQDWVHPSLQLNLGAAGDDRYYQHYPCCAGRLVAKEQWVTARVLDFDGTGIVVAKKYECTVCKTTYKGWDTRLLEQLPAHIQDDFDIIVKRNFAVRRTTHTKRLHTIPSTIRVSYLDKVITQKTLWGPSHSKRMGRRRPSP